MALIHGEEMRMSDTHNRADQRGGTGDRRTPRAGDRATGTADRRPRRLPATVQVPRELPPWRASLWKKKRLLSTRDLLQWLVDFAQAADAPHVSHDEIERFATVVTGHPFISRGFATGAALQPVVVRALQSVTHDQPWVLCSDTLHPFVTHVRLGTVSYAGRPQDVFLLAVRDLLSRPEARALKACAAPACGKLFLKRKRGIYCSPRCAKTARVQRRHGVPLEARYERRHAAYQRALERQKGKAIARRVERRGPRPPVPDSSN